MRQKTQNLCCLLVMVYDLLLRFHWLFTLHHSHKDDKHGCFICLAPLLPVIALPNSSVVDVDDSMIIKVQNLLPKEVVAVTSQTVRTVSEN